MKKSWSCQVSLWNQRFWRKYNFVVKAGSLPVAAKKAVEEALKMLPARSRVSEIEVVVKRTWQLKIDI
jgi:hypothetical protein